MSILEIILLVLLVLVYASYLVLLSLTIKDNKERGYTIPKKNIVVCVIFPIVFLFCLVADKIQEKL